MKHNVLIASGEYVSSDIVAEFGLIPPSFLPIGNRRLYYWQVAEIRKSAPGVEIFMSIPIDFQPDEQDTKALDNLDVKVVASPLGLSLGAALKYIMFSQNLTEDSLTILLGDTLIEGYKYDALDSISVGKTVAYYKWTDYDYRDGEISFRGVTSDGVERNILTGVFSISDVKFFVEALNIEKSDFISALEYYVSGKKVSCDATGVWLDFGHLHTYFQSRRRMTTERHFNRIEVEKNYLIKSSSNGAKIAAEAAWFEGLPDQLKPYAPIVCRADADQGREAYKIEYHYLAALNDLYVFGRLPISVWGSIFHACADFLETAAQTRAPSLDGIDSGKLYLGKTLERLEKFARDTGVNLEAPVRVNGRPAPSLLEIAESSAAMISPTSIGDAALVHGDFCFSNILFDFRSLKLKVIDPRGVDTSGRPSPYGDVRYETGKLHHSVVGMYDHIVAERVFSERIGDNDYRLDVPDTPLIRGVQDLFLSTRFGGRLAAQRAAGPISIQLFLSMLPLHADVPTRQTAFLANAVRLYQAL